MSGDGNVEDWEQAKLLWEYAITSRLTSAKPANPIIHDKDDKVEQQDVDMDGIEGQENSMAENPLLMTETGWSTGKHREKSIEIAMEDWSCPAFWLARNGVLAAY